MKVEQVKDAVNQVIGEAIGTENIIDKDFSNIISTGKKLIDAVGVDNYVKKISDVIGLTIIRNIGYKSKLQKLIHEGSDYGSMLRIINFEMSKAVEDPAWMTQDGVDYNPNKFYQPNAFEEVWNDITNYMVPVSYQHAQAESAFESANKLGEFVSGIADAVESSIQVATESMLRNLVCSAVADTIHSEFVEGVTEGATGVRAVNVLALYQTQIDDTLKDPIKALRTPEFIRFAVKTILDYRSLITSMTVNYNLRGFARHTPRESQISYMIDDFVSSLKVFLQSDTYHKEFLELDGFESIPYWNSIGKGEAAKDVKTRYKIHITSGHKNKVEIDWVIGTLFDRRAVGVINEKHHVTSNYNAMAEFTTNFHKVRQRYFHNDTENFIVFYLK